MRTAEVACLLLLCGQCLMTPAFFLNPIERSNNRSWRTMNTIQMIRNNANFALLFDCDGVIVETEELHRIAYNKAFTHFGLQLKDGSAVQWDMIYLLTVLATSVVDIERAIIIVDEIMTFCLASRATTSHIIWSLHPYNTVGGGKPKMKYYFNTEVQEWPICTKPYYTAAKCEEDKKKMVDMLQETKTEYYKDIVDALALPRPGVIEMMDAAIADPKLKVGICSAASRGGFDKIVNAIVGPERLAKMDIIIAGDDVSEKKPHPMIYDTARARLKAQGCDLAPTRCIVIEDSLVGLKAAKGAGMRCIVTYTPSTAKEDFYALGCDATVSGFENISLQDVFEPLYAAFDVGSESEVDAVEILESLRDPKPKLGVSTGVEVTLTRSPTKSSVAASLVYERWTPHTMIYASVSSAANALV